VGHAVVAELLERGYSREVAAYGGHLASAGRWNFQGNPRLASLVGRHLRSVQRYRALLEADGLLRSFCLEPGDMIDGQRAPVSRPQIVREVLVRAAALERLARRAPPRRPTKAQRRQNTRARRLVTAPAPSPAPLTAEQMLEAANRPGVETWVALAVAEGQGRSQRRPPRVDEPPPVSPAELDELDAELRELDRRQRERLRERARPPPPPD
jgi:hypothetical protein